MAVSGTNAQDEIRSIALGTGLPMSALGQRQTYAVHQPMSALPQIATAKADIRKRSCPLWAKSEHWGFRHQRLKQLLHGRHDAAPGQIHRHFCWRCHAVIFLEGGKEFGYRNHQRTVKRKRDSRGVRREATPRQRFLGEYDERDNSHGRDIHDAERKQDHEEEPTAAKAISTVE